MVTGIDAHMHGDILIYMDKKFPFIYYNHNLGGIIWAYNEKIKSCEDYPNYWDLLRDVTYNISKENAPFFYKVGIHPRTICEDLKGKSFLPDQIKKGLEKHLKDPKCLGIGEIGLDNEDLVQEFILKEQLKWCASYLPEDKKIGIHTPRNKKTEITKKILEILKDFKDLFDKIVIDHIELSTINLIKHTNMQIGMTLQKGKSSPLDIKKLVKENLYDINKIILNSDGGKKISDLYFDFIKGEYVPNEIKTKLIKHNIISFYNLENKI
jgi:predicted metal-dependent TIM-barrel fold hydrolase